MGKNYIDSRNNQFVLFDSSSTAKDAAQTTIPYIDSQKVAPQSGVWLTGLGLYHKGTIGYGGFVGFLVKTLDFSSHLLPSSLEAAKSSRLVLADPAMRYDFAQTTRNL